MGKNILIIQPDDEKFSSLTALINRINLPGHKVLRSHSPDEALCIDAEVNFILACVQLNPIGSVSPVRELKRHFHNAPVIIIAGNDGLDTEAYAISQEAEEVLVEDNFNAAQLERALVIARERNALSARKKNILEEYRRHFDNGPIPMWISDEKTLKFLFVNKAAVEKYGYSKEEFIEMTILDIRPKEDVPKMLQHYHCREANYFDAGYWKHLKRNGEVFYVHVYSHSTVFRGVEARLCFVVDVNEQLIAKKRNEELMARAIEQKERLDNILSSISEAIWSRDYETRELLYVNDAYYRLYGLEPGATLEKKLLLERIHPDDREEFLQAIRDVKAYGHVEYSYRYLNDDGTIKILKGEATYKKGANGRPDTIDGITTDITREKEFYDQLRNTEQKLLTTINNTRDLIWSVNRELRIIFCNRAYQDFFKKWFGISLDEGDYVLGDWHSEEFVERRRKEYERSLNGESFTTVVEEHFKDGTQYFEITSSPIIDVDEKIVGVNCVSRDITAEEKRLHQIRRESEHLREIVQQQVHKVRGAAAATLGLIAQFDTGDCGNAHNKEVIKMLLSATKELDEVMAEMVDKTHETEGICKGRAQEADD